MFLDTISALITEALSLVLHLDIYWMSPKLQKEFFAVDFVGVEAKVQPIKINFAI